MTSDTFAICVRVDDAYAEQTPTCLLRRAISLTLERHDVPVTAGVTLLVTGDEDVQKLNRRFRDVDAPTDVLSFPSMEAGESPMPGVEEEPYLGDIIVAFPYTALHAHEDGHAIEHVLALLAVHGTLHLLGYDHDDADAQAEMWDLQAEVLTALEIPIEVIPPLYSFDVDEDDDSGA